MCAYIYIFVYVYIGAASDGEDPADAVARFEVQGLRLCRLAYGGMLAYADVCLRMLTYADVCLIRVVVSHTQAENGALEALIITNAHVAGLTVGIGA
jgi:hypothetical protein